MFSRSAALARYVQRLAIPVRRLCRVGVENDEAKLSPDVMATVESQFTPEHQDTVTELLAMYGQLSSERDVEPVHKAILQLANGDLERLRRLVYLAKRDYRDVLAWASQRVKHKPLQ